MYFNFYTLDKNKGICCDHCGTYIRNVVEIHVGGFVYKVGLDCFRNLQKENKFGNIPNKVLNQYLKSIKEYNIGFEIWKSCETLEQFIAACEKNPKALVFVRWKCYGWKTEKFEEITQEIYDNERNYMINEFYPYRIESKQKEMEKKFKNVKLNF